MHSCKGWEELTENSGAKEVMGSLRVSLHSLSLRVSTFHCSGVQSPMQIHWRVCERIEEHRDELFLKAEIVQN